LKAGERLVAPIGPMAQSHRRAGPWMGGLAGFGALFDLKESGNINDPYPVFPARMGSDQADARLRVGQPIRSASTSWPCAPMMCWRRGRAPLPSSTYFATGNTRRRHRWKAGRVRHCRRLPPVRLRPRRRRDARNASACTAPATMTCWFCLGRRRRPRSKGPACAWTYGPGDPS